MNATRLAAAVAAAASGRAVPVAAARSVRVRPDALLLALVGLAGEPGAVHALAVGPRHGRPLFACVPDPRDPAQLHALLGALARQVGLAWETAREDGTHLQVVVSGRRAAELLDQVGERARRHGAPPDVRLLGARLGYLADRRHVAGQQSTVLAPDALTAHLQTGQAPGDDAHLGALLEWVRPGAGGGGTGTLAARLLTAEARPAGPRRDPESDRAELAPALAARRAALLHGDTTAAERTADTVAGLLVEDVGRQGVLLREAVDALTSLTLADGTPLPDLPDPLLRTSGLGALDRLAAAEAAAFRGWCRRLERTGLQLRVRDTPDDAAGRLAARETALENLQAALLLGDPVHREQGVLDGRVLRLHITSATAGGPGRPACSVGGLPPEPVEDTVEGAVHGAAALDPGDRWTAAAPGAPAWTVRSAGTGADGTRTAVLCRPSAGERLPSPGDVLDAVTSVPAWGAAGARAAAVRRRQRLPLPAHLAGRPGTPPGETAVPPAAVAGPGAADGHATAAPAPIEPNRNRSTR